MHRIDWELALTRTTLGIPEANPSPAPHLGEIKDDIRRVELRQTVGVAVQQFLHVEQGAMVCSARIVEAVPDMDRSSRLHPDDGHPDTPRLTRACCAEVGLLTRSTTEARWRHAVDSAVTCQYRGAG